MRKFTTYANKDIQIKKYLNILADRKSSIKDYSNAFYELGAKLSIQIKKSTAKSKNVVLACSTEDADWLARGIFDNLIKYDPKLVVFWNLRVNPFGNKDLPIAPIIKTYSEVDNSCDVLIVCKSIIYTSCVVRTNLTNLIEKINPKTILIVAPVIFDQAEETLNKEFSNSISSKFKYIYFAKDFIVNNNGEVEPGIGGEIYKRLGLGDSEIKDSYVPKLVKERREVFK